LAANDCSKSPLIYNFRHYYRLAAEELGKTFRAEVQGRWSGSAEEAGRRAAHRPLWYELRSVSSRRFRDKEVMRCDER